MGINDFSKVTQQKRFEEHRLIKRDALKGTSFYQNEEGESVYITPAPPPEPTPPPDPEIPSDYVRIVQKYFVGETVWSFEHGLGNTPAVTVWKGGVNVYGFGSQPFGTSPFGGGTFTSGFQVATHEPTIEEVDVDNITVTWTGDESGKVVCVG